MPATNWFRHQIVSHCRVCHGPIKRYAFRKYKVWETPRVPDPEPRPARTCHICIWRKCSERRGCNPQELARLEVLIRFAKPQPRRCAA